jgi:capsular polysaccharide biosynthesis protein
VMSELSLDDQLAAFAEAEVVVAPHGAALVNLVASRTTTVVELLGESYLNGCYYALAAALGLPYWYLITANRGRHDLEVDLAALDRTLDAACA